MVDFSANISELHYKPKYKVFHSLMNKRVREILLVSSAYDNFILEEDGRLSDQIYSEFHELNLRTLPHITRVSSANEALELLEEKEFDLVVTMRRLFDMDPFEFGKQIKKIRNIPVNLLLTSLAEINLLPSYKNKNNGIDQIYLWNGDSAIFVSLTKLLEDKMNVDHDTENGLVRVIIVVEDSIRFYSLYLPLVYGEIMRQTQYLIQEGVNDYYRLLQMRARPKILLAKTYEDAMRYYRKYKDYVIGIISDIRFPRNGEVDSDAGISLIRKIKDDAPTVPTILQSSDISNKKIAHEIGAHFIYKNSRSLLEDMRKYMVRYMGFGDFVFRLEDGEEVARASNLHEFRKAIKKVPEESLRYHGKADAFSGWLMARGEFDMALKLKPLKVTDFEDVDLALREFLVESIDELISERKHVVTDFHKESYNSDFKFLRLRPGSLGGKGRGIAFLMFLLNSYNLSSQVKEVSIKIPKTIVIGTKEHEHFMEKNDLYEIALSKTAQDKEIIDAFKAATLSKELKSDLRIIMKDWLGDPVAVRSSSIAEDSQFQPFAGIFSTYFLPNQQDLDTSLQNLYEAIKMVYASTFTRTAKSYSKTINQRIDESKMAVIIQKVVGKKYENYFYPDYSGSATSYNFYPVGKRMKSKDGIASLALGLGRIIVEGGLVKQFCPEYPDLNIYSNAVELVNNSQRKFFAVDLSRDLDVRNLRGEEDFLQKLNLSDAKRHGILELIADTFDPQNESIQIGHWENTRGSPIITFNRQLQYDDDFPLAEIIKGALDLGEKAMGCPVEIEFAGNLPESYNDKYYFYFLQIRPSAEDPALKGFEYEVTDEIQRTDMVACSTKFSGNRVIRGLTDFIYVKPETFDKLHTQEMAEEIGKLNGKLLDQNRRYILVTIGRLGTFDKNLGVPVKWYHIDGVQVIIETGIEDFQVEHSQGSHFFQNIINAQIGYLHVKYDSSEEFIDWDWLEQQPVLHETTYIKHVKVKEPVTVIMDGKQKVAVIKKPDKLAVNDGGHIELN